MSLLTPLIAMLVIGQAKMSPNHAALKQIQYKLDRAEAKIDAQLLHEARRVSAKGVAIKCPFCTKEKRGLCCAPPSKVKGARAVGESGPLRKVNSDGFPRPTIIRSGH